MNRRKFWGLLVLLLITCLTKAQDTRYIDLKNFEAPQQLKYYKIAGVTDNRPDTTSLGTLQLGFLSRKTYIIQLKEGVRTSLKTFIAANFRQDTTTIPIEVRITALSVKEMATGLRTEIAVRLTAAFFMNGERLTEYTGNGSAKTMGDLLIQVKDLIGQNLQSCLLAFDDWWNQYKNLYLPNAPVPVEVVINTTPDTARLINYSRNRLLAIDDFRAKPDDADKAVAITASNMTLKYSVITDMDHLKMMVTITAYFDRSRSWFKHTQFDDMVLMHEQGHFDITAIKACELADTLQHCIFTKSNCYEMIEKIQLLKQQELRILHDLYDERTGHGAGIGVQQKWSKELKEQLARQTCFP